jgi:hypothetical protein
MAYSAERSRARSALGLALLLIAWQLATGRLAAEPFTVAMLPDTQNYVDYTRQRTAGFALDGRELFLEQMRDIASKGVANGGNVVFVAAVGDVWQHLVSRTDPAHERRGVRSIGGETGVSRLIQPDETRGFEVPSAIAGYRLLNEARIPFGVPPGNHDYDAWWTAPVAGTVPADAPAEALANVPPASRTLHIGGLETFKQAFGENTELFRNQDWYVASFEGGTSNAQIFTGGGYRFLHLALEMHPGDPVLDWAQSVLDDHPGLPTIVSTHDYLSPRNERRPLRGFDLALADPADHHDPETIWRTFIRRNDQIFMVLSGHQAGQGMRIDENEAGHAVYQMLADYQDRGQAALDAGAARDANGRAPALGDGWYRELTFDLDGDAPRLDVRTYSSHYRAYSSDLPTYALWYRPHEQPQMTDAEFLRADEFTLELADFRQRFGLAVSNP